MFIAPVQSVCNCNSISPIPIPFLVSSPSSSLLRNLHRNPNRWNLKQNEEKRYQKKRGGPVCRWFLPIDAWAPTIDSESIAPSLFAASLFPYIGFLYFLTKSKSAPKLTLFGFYFLLAFVGATIPAGIYAKVKYGTSLSNVDWLHGGAESLLTLTNLFIVLGLRQALRKVQDAEETASGSSADVEEEQEKASLRK